MRLHYRVTHGWHIAAKTLFAAARFARRRLRVIATLVLALSIGSTSLPTLAQQAGPAYTMGTHMEVSLPKEICVGEIGSFTVKVIRTVKVVVPQSNILFKFRFERSAIPINATSANSGIARLLQTRQFTGFDVDLPGLAEFDYVGEKAGTTRIDISTDSVSMLAGEEFDVPPGQTDSDKFKATVAVKVLSCNFEVTAVSTFEAPGMKVVAVIDKAVMRTDAPGHYTGKAKVTWTGSWEDFSFTTRGGGSTCKHKLEAPPSEAYLQGKIDGSGYLVMDLSYQAQDGKWQTDCRGPIQSVDLVKLNPGPLLNINVPVSSRLEKKLSQDIEMLGGEVLIVVVPKHTGSGQ